jgi:hypothetical protein
MPGSIAVLRNWATASPSIQFFRDASKRTLPSSVKAQKLRVSNECALSYRLRLSIS